jgi:hypothetical protein
LVIALDTCNQALLGRGIYGAAAENVRLMFSFLKKLGLSTAFLTEGMVSNLADPLSDFWLVYDLVDETKQWCFFNKVNDLVLSLQLDRRYGLRLL